VCLQRGCEENKKVEVPRSRGSGGSTFFWTNPGLSVCENQDVLHNHDTVFEFKWLHEIETKIRLEGDIMWLKAVFRF
jgi:hypothetical protein